MIRCVYRTLGLHRPEHSSHARLRDNTRNQTHVLSSKKIGLLIKGGRFTKLVKGCSPLVEKEADTGAYQMLPEIPLLAGFDLGARVVEIVIFDKSTDVRSKEII